jgi:hypothetical protein
MDEVLNSLLGPADIGGRLFDRKETDCSSCGATAILNLGNDPRRKLRGQGFDESFVKHLRFLSSFQVV